MKLADARLDTLEGELTEMFLDSSSAAKKSVPGKSALRFQLTVDELVYLASEFAGGRPPWGRVFQVLLFSDSRACQKLSQFVLVSLFVRLSIPWHVRSKEPLAYMNHTDLDIQCPFFNHLLKAELLLSPPRSFRGAP